MVQTQKGSAMSDTVVVSRDTHRGVCWFSYVLWYFVPFAALTGVFEDRVKSKFDYVPNSFFIKLVMCKKKGFYYSYEIRRLLKHLCK